ncbi:hypothetical protein SASPL_137773 [Salvia splendens]|uniref:Exocyst component Exo84 C-terminal domain-containing protein n=1 Tax=Salvia splendens TaxID=180675 RepID=A0A8X8WTG5_SALSN|nr:hypothetical protein SASPL_137773 [Salvia splendens]
MDSTPTSRPRFRFRDHRQELADDSSSEGHTTDDDDQPHLHSMTAKGVQHLCSELLEIKQQSDHDFRKNVFSNYSAFLMIMKDIQVLQTELLGLKSQASLQKRHVQEFSDKIYSTLVSDDTTMLRETLPVETMSPSVLDVHAQNVCDILDSLVSELRLDDALALLEVESEYLTLVARHPRVPAPELQKALLGLCQLGENHLANDLMLQYYHSRIASGIYNLQPSKGLFPNVLYIQQVAKCVCSMISQAERSYVSLNGETQLTRWAAEEMGVFAACFVKYIESISDISGRLSAAVDALRIGMSYCSLLETHRILVKHSFMELVRPCIEGVMQLHIDHLSRVMSVVASTDTWSVVEEISPLIAFEMESSVLKGIMDLLTAYVVILESAITGDTDAMEKEGFKINLPETPTQGVIILANLSTLVQFSSSIIRNLFDGFISNIFSPNAGHESSPEIRHDSCRYLDLTPSVPYLELNLELKKLEKLDCIDTGWLMSLFSEVMDATLEWISTKSEIWTITENLLLNRTKFVQFILDTQFLVEMARHGEYLSEKAKTISDDMIFHVEAPFLSAGLSPLRDSNDDEWPANMVIAALQKLQQLLENEDAAGEEGSSHESVIENAIQTNSQI